MDFGDAFEPQSYFRERKKNTMAMPKPVFKTHVAANKYKKWNILSENLILR